MTCVGHSVLVYRKNEFYHKSQKNAFGHRMAGVMAIYNLHDWIDEQREAYELWDKKLMRL